MSKIYHGSIEVVERPEIRQPNRSLDYGPPLHRPRNWWNEE